MMAFKASRCHTLSAIVLCAAAAAYAFLGSIVAASFVPSGATVLPRQWPSQSLTASQLEETIASDRLPSASILAASAACLVLMATRGGRLARSNTVSCQARATEYEEFLHRFTFGFFGTKYDGDIDPRPQWQLLGDPVKYPEPTSEKMFATMVGADVETGNVRWDPMSFHKLFDRNFDFNGVMAWPHVQFLREAELKHGRICMLAFVGVIVQSVYHFPGRPDVYDWTQALEACCKDKNARLGIIQIMVFIFIVEGRTFCGDMWVGMGEREAGDLGWDPLKLTRKEGFDARKAQLQELKNGRLAMIGMASVVCNKLIPGSVPLLSGFLE
mmetsp:Transcript_73928/g.175951  ORF Transcript_73928/g.175951 Transcript_73928/m.175951 type:complete len:328 (-) Transcript_73928:254-1237(-)